MEKHIWQELKWKVAWNWAKEQVVFNEFIIHLLIEFVVVQKRG